MTDNRRPCTVNGDMAYFHRWIEEDGGVLSIPPMARFDHAEISIRRFKDLNVCDPGCSITPLRKTWALIEYINGEVAKVDPESVRFTDN